MRSPSTRINPAQYFALKCAGDQQGSGDSSLDSSMSCHSTVGFLTHASLTIASARNICLGRSARTQGQNTLVRSSTHAFLLHCLQVAHPICAHEHATLESWFCQTRMFKIITPFGQHRAQERLRPGTAIGTTHKQDLYALRNVARSTCILVCLLNNPTHGVLWITPEHLRISQVVLSCNF